MWDFCVYMYKTHVIMRAYEFLNNEHINNKWVLGTKKYNGGFLHVFAIITTSEQLISKIHQQEK